MRNHILALGWLAVVTSGYNALPAQTDSTPWINAAGERVRECTLAVSPRMERRGFVLHSLVFITGHLPGLEHCHGYFYVKDRTARDNTLLQVDLFFYPRWQALRLGRRFYTHLIRRIG